MLKHEDKQAEVGAEKKELREKQKEYALLIDKYQSLFNQQRQLERMATSRDHRIAILDDEREKLHRRLESLGKELGKSKHDVLGDIIRREGNLSEYGVKGYGVISHADLYHETNFGGLHIDRKTGMCRREVSEAALLQGEIDDDYFPEGQENYEREYYSVDVPEIGPVSHRTSLEAGEFGIVFGSTFTMDIDYFDVEMRPPDYHERWRRAVKAAQEFGAEPLLMTMGGFHDTTTISGVVIRSEDIEQFARLLRENPDRYSVVRSEIPADILDRDKYLAIRDFESMIKRMFLDEEGEGVDSISEQYMENRRQYFNE